MLVLVSILYKCIAGRSRPVRAADWPITARYTLIKNASWGISTVSTISFSVTSASSISVSPQ